MILIFPFLGLCYTTAPNFVVRIYSYSTIPGFERLRVSMIGAY